VHVGVSGIAKELTLEQLAHNDGYDKLDIHGSRPETRCCQQGAPAFLMSGIDMSRVCDAVKQSACGVDAVLSFDPGRSVYGVLHRTLTICGILSCFLYSYICCSVVTVIEVIIDGSSIDGFIFFGTRHSSNVWCCEC